MPSSTDATKPGMSKSSDLYQILKQQAWSGKPYNAYQKFNQEFSAAGAKNKEYGGGELAESQLAMSNRKTNGHKLLSQMEAH